MYNMNPDGAPDIPRAVSTPEEKALFLTMCPEYCETRYETGEGIPNFETMCHDWNVLHVFPTIIEDSVTHTPFIPGPLFMKDVSSLKIYFDRDYTSALTRERAIDSMPGGIGKVSLDDGVCTHHQTKHPASFPLGICSSVPKTLVGLCWLCQLTNSGVAELAHSVARRCSASTARQILPSTRGVIPIL